MAENRKDSEYAGILLQASGGIGILKAYSVLMRQGEISVLWEKSIATVFVYGILLLTLGVVLVLVGEFLKKQKKGAEFLSLVFTPLMAILWLLPSFILGRVSSLDIGFVLLLFALVAWLIIISIRKDGQSDKSPDR